jgi:hypothetical protein
MLRLVDLGQWWGFLSYPGNECVYIRRIAFNFGIHAFGGVVYEPRQAATDCQTVDEGPEAHPLDNPCKLVANPSGHARLCLCCSIFSVSHASHA